MMSKQAAARIILRVYGVLILLLPFLEYVIASRAFPGHFHQLYHYGLREILIDLFLLILGIALLLLNRIATTVLALCGAAAFLLACVELRTAPWYVAVLNLPLFGFLLLPVALSKWLWREQIDPGS